MNGLRSFCCLALMLALSACSNPPNSALLSVPITAQAQSKWCWAASGKMVMNFIHPASNVIECDEANKGFSQSTCCTNGSSSQCDNGGWPQLDKYGNSVSYSAVIAFPRSGRFLRIELRCSDFVTKRRWLPRFAAFV